MKTLISTILATLLISIVLTSCNLNNEDNDKPVQGKITGTLINTSDCLFQKSAHTDDETPDTLSCVYFNFDKKNEKLTLSHKNAAFNCCPGELSTTFSLSGDTLIIEEAEETSGCNCNCLFDLDMKIEGIISKTYVIKFVEPYIGDHPVIIFDIDLTSEQQGSFCLTRKFYPYGLSIID